jgi:CRISPR/Cas system-associated protein Csx1
MKMPVESEDMKMPVELEETRHRAFFDFPELSGQLVTDRTSEANELKRRLHRLKEEMEAERSKASLAFNAVKYNAPLVLHYLEQPDGRKILRLLREALAGIEGARSVVTEGSTVRVRRFRVSRGEVSGWVITAALSTYLSEVISSVRSKDRRLKGILEVNQKLEVNKYVLEHEADQIAKATEDMRPGERRLLREVLKLGGSGNPKRNFFAHAGLLADRTYVTKTEDGDVVLEYDENRLKEIMGWVRDPTP